MTNERAEIAVVEAAYRLDVPPDTWLEGLVEAARPALDGGCGVMGITFELRPPEGLRLTSAVAAAGPVPAGTTALLTEVVSGLDSSEVDDTWAHPLALESASDAWARSKRGPFREWSGFDEARRLGMFDALAAKMLDASGVGFQFCAPLPHERRVRPEEERRWARVMTHVVAGMRLRGALLEGDGDAVLSPDGRLAHAVGDARSARARDALREAALRIDRARTAVTDVDDALKMWRGLVSGRWSLLDRFDSDGRRFLVARRNDPAVGFPRALSDRERQVLAYAALGHSNKHIAYTLGLSPSTISTHLAAAMRALGARGREALPELLSAAREEVGAS